MLTSSAVGASGCWRENASSCWIKRCGAPRAFLRAGKVFLDRVVTTREPPRRKIEAADDDGEHVVEVVRDAAGELSDRLHLLRLAQGLFRRRTPLHLGSEFLRALLHALFEGFGQRAQLVLGSVTLAFALTQLFRGVHQHLANGVDLAHRQLTRSRPTRLVRARLPARQAHAPHLPFGCRSHRRATPPGS